MKILVILGYRLNDDGTPSPLLLSRCEKGYNEIKKGGYDILCLSGGSANKLAPRSEAEAMRDYFIEKGLSNDFIVLEKESLTTLQNAKYCARLFKKTASEIVICTSKEHLNRKYLNPYRLFKLFFLASGVKIIKL